ncbi:hypothetical protein [Embleya sp. AB8]|uniref:hypothetical protein n=1 Tax=Embleya sp. AB8 TaxID=3156304 RepID=UPI003C77D6B2
MRNRPLTATEAVELGDAVGRIAALAAMAINREYPRHGLRDLVEQFTREHSTTFLAGRYLAGIDKGMPAAEAAADAGRELIRAWADARRAAMAHVKPLTCGNAVGDVKSNGDIHSIE